MSSEEYNGMIVRELKEICKKKKLKVSGKRSELIERIIEHDNKISSGLTKENEEVQVKESDKIITQVYEFISNIKNPKIILLREKEVIQWLFGDLSFLQAIEKKNKTQDSKKYKVLEDKWGRKIVKIRCPKLKLDKQWTNKFGEHLCEEIYMLLGKDITKPKKKMNYQPDSEVDDSILEAKAGTFYTGGTAGEKILGCPFKYAEIPGLYNKPLKIVCMGGAEKVCREQYGNLTGAKTTRQKQKFLDFFKENSIEYVAATDLLIKLSSESTPHSS